MLLYYCKISCNYSSYFLCIPLIIYISAHVKPKSVWSPFLAWLALYNPTITSPTCQRWRRRFAPISWFEQRKQPDLQTNIRSSHQSSLPPQENTSLCEIGLSTKMFTCHKPFNFKIKSKMLEEFSGQAFPY